MTKHRAGKWVAAATFVLTAGASWAIPDAITVSGTLQDETGGWVEGVYPWHVKFYASSEEETVLASAGSSSGETVTTVSQGVFAITIKPVPDQIVERDEVWYSLAMDLNQNGFGPEDEFQTRFQITSVPFSLSAQPVGFFVTNTVTSFLSSSDFPTTQLRLGGFATPPGGVDFSQMSMRLRNQAAVAARTSFGVYDTSGTLLYSTGEIIIPSGYDAVHTASVSGRLQPSTFYYAGWGVNQPAVVVNSYEGPPIPGAAGTIPGVVVNGMIPSSFDPAAMVAITDFNDNRRAGPVIGFSQQ